MPRRQRLLSVALLAVVAGSVLWFLSQDEGAGLRSDPAEREYHGPRAAAPELVGGAPAAPPAREHPTTEPTAAALPDGIPVWGLGVRTTRGRGSSVHPAAGVLVKVTLVGPEGTLFEWEAVSDAGGACQFAPLELPEIPRRLAGAVELTVQAGEGAEASWRASLGELAHRIYAAVPRDGLRWIDLTLPVARGARLKGRLLTASGHPVEGVWMSTEPFQAGSCMVPSRWDGGFELQLRAAQGPELGMEAEVSGAFTIQHVQRVGDEGVGARIDMRLPPAGEARGRVIGPAGEGLAGIHLVLAPTYWNPNAELELADGSYYPAHNIFRLKTRSAADGRFAFPGLNAEEPYALWWPVDAERWQRLPDPVHRGDDGLEVALARYRFHVALVDPQTKRPLYGETKITRLDSKGNRAHLRSRNEGATPDEEGTLAAPGERFRLHAWARGFAVTSTEFEMPRAAGDHEVRIALNPMPSKGALRLRFVDGQGSLLPGMPHSLMRPLDGTYERLRLDLPAAHEPKGWLRVPDVPPGPILLETPERLGFPPKGRWRFTLPVEARFTVPEVGLLEVDVPCPQGGSIRLHLHEPATESPGAIGRLTLHNDPVGKESPWWYAPTEDGDWDFKIIGDGRFVPDGRSYECSVLAPGAWTLKIEGNATYGAVSLPLRIQPGLVTDVHVTLRRPD